MFQYKKCSPFGQRTALTIQNNLSSFERTAHKRIYKYKNIHNKIDNQNRSNAYRSGYLQKQRRQKNKRINLHRHRKITNQAQNRIGNHANKRNGSIIQLSFVKKIYFLLQQNKAKNKKAKKYKLQLYVCVRLP